MATDLTVAKIILDQIKTIDRCALMAWGAKQFVGTDDTIQFKTSGMVKWKGTVAITLNASDLYDVKFFKIRKFEITNEEVVSDVFVEDLVNVIDEKVG